MFRISFLYAFRYNRSTFYQPSLHDTDFVCSAKEDHGTRECSDIKPYYLGETECHGFFENNSVVNNSVCVNWNQYYINCTPNGPNPLFDTTSFDNIGIAWIAIFQVRKLSQNSNVTIIISLPFIAQNLPHEWPLILTGYYPGGMVRYHVFCPRCSQLLELDILFCTRNGK